MAMEHEEYMWHETWTCGACTMSNSGGSRCKVCDTPKAGKSQGAPDLDDDMMSAMSAIGAESDDEDNAGSSKPDAKSDRKSDAKSDSKAESKGENKDSKSSDGKSASTEWSCEACTSINTTAASRCAVCNTPSGRTSAKPSAFSRSTLSAKSTPSQIFNDFVLQCSVNHLLEDHPWFRAGSVNHTLPWMKGVTAIHVAAANGADRSLKLLLKHGGEMNAKTTSSTRWRYLDRRFTPEPDDSLLRQSSSLFAVTGLGQSLGLDARDYEYSAKPTTETKAKPSDSSSGSGEKAISAETALGGQHSAKDAFAPEGWVLPAFSTPIMLAVRMGKSSTATILLKETDRLLHVDAEDEKGQTALLLAVNSHMFVVTQQLVGYGAHADDIIRMLEKQSKAWKEELRKQAEALGIDPDERQPLHRLWMDEQPDARRRAYNDKASEVALGEGVLKQLLVAVRAGSSEFPALRRRAIESLTELPEFRLPRGVMLIVVWYMY